IVTVLPALYLASLPSDLPKCCSNSLGNQQVEPPVDTFRQIRLTRRKFLYVGAGLATTMTLAGCLPAAAPQATGRESPAAGPIEIDVWTGWTEDAAINIEKFLTGYNESQDRIVATHVVVPEAMTQKLLAAVSAGNPPATAVVFGASIAYQLAAQKALIALDAVGNEEQVETLRQWMAPALWELGVYEGSFYYASMWNQCLGCYVNVNLAEEAGVDVNSPLQTLDERAAGWEQLATYDATGNIDVLGGAFTWAAMVMGRFL